MFKNGTPFGTQLKSQSQIKFLYIFFSSRFTTSISRERKITKTSLLNQERIELDHMVGRGPDLRNNK